MTDTATDAPAEPIVADEDFLTVDVCNRMAIVWAKAASAFPLRGPRSHALEQMAEWERAAADLQTAGDEGYLVFAGALTPGQHVNFGDRGWLRFVRHTQNSSLQLEDFEDPRPVYLSVLSPTSPVLVQKVGTW